MFAGDIFFWEKNVEQMKKTISRSFSPKKFPIKKSKKIKKYVPKPFFIEQFSYEDFGRILAGFCEDFVIFLAVWLFWRVEKLFIIFKNKFFNLKNTLKYQKIVDYWVLKNQYSSARRRVNFFRVFSRQKRKFCLKTNLRVVQIWSEKKRIINARKFLDRKK